MTGESSNGVRRRRPWAVAVLVAVLLIGGVVWGVLSQRAGGEPAAATTPAATWPTATPQPTTFDTPAPGATGEVTKPATADEVPLDEAAPPVEGAVVEVVGVSADTFSSTLPGEPSGDSIVVAVRIRNDGAAAIDTAGANVNLAYGGDDRTPAVAVTTPDAPRWPTSIAAGAEATAEFTFVAPLAAKGDVRVTVDLLASAPDIVFVGPRP